jgi:UrcA family protein
MTRTNTTFRSTALSILAALLVTAAGTSMACAETGQDKILITHEDLNLNTAEGRAKLHARIRRAAVRACGGASGRVDIKEAVAFKACTASAAQGTVAKVSALTGVDVAAR